MLKIGMILFAIGLLLISPLDEIFILLPLSAIYGMWIFPLFMGIAILCLIIGAVLIGKHIIPVVENPVVLAMIVVTIIITIWVVYEAGWWVEYI